jgi:hypothetical protein
MTPYLPSDAVVILQDAGEQLAEQLLHTELSREEVITARLSDLLPPAPEHTEGFAAVISRLCAAIPLCCLKYGLVSNQDLSDLIYRWLEQEQVDPAIQAHVLNFFRGFCRIFFHATTAPASGETQALDVVLARPRLHDVNQPNAEAAELARIIATRSGLWEQVGLQKAAEIPVNFNDLLAILQESYAQGELQRAAEQEDEDADAGYMYAAFVMVIECMTPEERLDPALLLDHYDLARRYRRRARIAANAEISLSMVDHCLAALAEFRRNYQLYLERTIGS